MLARDLGRKKRAAAHRTQRGSRNLSALRSRKTTRLDVLEKQTKGNLDGDLS